MYIVNYFEVLRYTRVMLFHETKLSQVCCGLTQCMIEIVVQEHVELIHIRCGQEK
jgi:hypothetical protein